MMPARAVLAALALGLGLSGCYLAGWLDAFDYSVTDETWRVEDLRQLSVRVDPPGLLVDPRIIFAADDGDPLLDALPAIPVTVTLDAFDPREGDIDVTFQLCPGPATFDLWTPAADFNPDRPRPPSLLELSADCAARDLDDLDDPLFARRDVRDALLPRGAVERAATPSREDPFGRVGAPPVAHFTLTPHVLRAMARLVPGGLRDFGGGYLHVRVVTSRDYLGREESETGVLPVELRLDVGSPFMAEGELARILDEMAAERLCPVALRDLCLLPYDEVACQCAEHPDSESCPLVDAITDAGTDDGGALDGGALDELCFPIDHRTCGADCRPLPPACADTAGCLWMPTPNRRMEVLGLVVHAPDGPGETELIPVDGEVTLPLRWVQAVGGARLELVLEPTAEERYQATQVIYASPPPSDGGPGGGTLIEKRELSLRKERPCAQMYLPPSASRLHNGEGPGIVNPYYADRCVEAFRSSDDGERSFVHYPNLSAEPELRAGDEDVVRFTLFDGRGSAVEGTFRLKYE